MGIWGCTILYLLVLIWPGSEGEKDVLLSHCHSPIAVLLFFVVGLLPPSFPRSPPSQWPLILSLLCPGDLWDGWVLVKCEETWRSDINMSTTLPFTSSATFIYKILSKHPFPAIFTHFVTHLNKPDVPCCDLVPHVLWCVCCALCLTYFLCTELPCFTGLLHAHESMYCIPGVVLSPLRLCGGLKVSS